MKQAPSAVNLAQPNLTKVAPPSAVLIGIRILLLLNLFILVAIANLCQYICLMIRPFSKKAGRRINSKLAETWWFLLMFCLEKFFNFQLRIHYESENNRQKTSGKNLFLIINHQNLLDALVILSVAKSERSLSHLKWFVKKSLQWIPFLGWGLSCLECIFLKRTWDQDRDQLSLAFKNIKSHQDPVWLVSFVEGTRKNPDRLQKSQAYARTQKQAPFENVLYPRVKGFTSSLEALGERIDAIYDLTIIYENDRVSLWDLFLGRASPIFVHIEELSLGSIPSETLSRGQWLINRFEKKDHSIKNFKQGFRGPVNY